MSALSRRAVTGACLAVGTAAALGLAAGGIRLLPWLWSPEVPLEVALPFARALGAAATETALMFGLPIGVALAVATFVDRGEARALLSLGASPARLVRGASLPIVALGAGLALASLAWGSSADVPGRFAVDLIAQGRASCSRGAAPKSAQVPLVGVTWLCFPGRPPRVTGKLPGLGDLGSYTAGALTPSDDLRQVSFADLRVFTKKLDGEVSLELSVASATVRGLPGWGRSAKLPFTQRACLVAATAVGLALGAAWSVVAFGVARRAAALAIGGLPALVAFAMLSRLDATSLGPQSYALVPAAGALAVALVVGAQRFLPSGFAWLRARFPRR